MRPPLARLLVSSELRAHAEAIEFEDVVAGKKPGVAVMLVASLAYRRIAARCIDSIVDYCARHSYTVKLVREPSPDIGRTKTWLRIPALMRLMDLGYPTIWSIDSDVLITNPRIRLEPLLRRLGPEHGYRFSLNCAVDGARNINLGSMFWRNCASSRLLLDLIYRNSASFLDHPWAENASFIDLWTRFPEVRSITRLEFQHRLFNAYPEWIDPWQEGDFLVHLAGLRGAAFTAAVERFSALSAPPRRKGDRKIRGRRAAGRRDQRRLARR